MANVGYATLQIIPSVRGIGTELRRQLVAPAGDAGDAAGEAAGGGFASTFKGALAAIGVAEVASQIGAQFSDAFAQALEQGHATKVLKAQLGSSGATAKRQGEAVGKLFANGVTDTFEEGAEAIREVVRGGLVKPDATLKQLDAIGTKMVDVAKVFGTDMNLQGQAVAAMLKNKLAPDATAALDLITVGFQKLGPNAEDLLETFQEYPVQLRKLGLDARTAMGLFQQGIQGGARDTDIIADAMKEFSIRAVDMSQGSQDAYKSIGLNAEKMSLQIAGGGKGATAGLQTVLDKLRDMKDPVEREAAAVGLFGTQAEELGAALFKLDPGKARSSFDSVDGAAAKLGKTLRSGPSHEITVFTRALKQGLVDFVGGQVLPVLGRWGGVLNHEVLPPLQVVGGVLGMMFLPTLRILGGAISGTINWLREWGVWLIPLGIIIAGVTLAMTTQAIAIGIVTGVLSVYRAAILVGTAVTQGFAAAQAFLTAVMNANPIVLVITAIVALGAALVIAYKRSETFRSIVQAVWSGIKTGALWLWNNALKPMFDGFMVGLRAIGAAAVWLWGVIGPVLSWIWTAVKVLATIIVVVLVLPVVAAVKVLGAIWGWLWKVAIGPVVGWIAGGARWLWGVVKGQFALFMAGIRALGAVGKWLWTNALKPVFGWIAAGARLLWSGMKVQAGYIMAGLRAVGAAGTWLWRTALAPAFRGIGTAATWLYDKGLKPPIDRAKALARSLGSAFKSGAEVVGRAWQWIADKAKTPIRYVVNTVYNSGIVPVWNKVAGAFGAPKLTPAKFAVGGPVFGAGTETSDDVPAWLSHNEHVWTAKEVRGAGGHGAVAAMRRWAAAGGGSVGTPGFAKGGGLFGWVKGAASKGLDLAKSGVSWLKDGVKASAMAGLNSIVKPLIAKISGSASLYRDMVTRIPKRMVESIIGYSGKADSELDKAGFGGRSFAGALRWARTQHGLPYQWGGNGNPSWDCSGILSAVESVIRGQKPHRRWATGAFSGSTAPPGWVLGARSPYMIGITNSGVGHTAGTINGTNVESRGGDGVVVGSRARSYLDPMFTHTYGFKGYANGGSPRPGEIAWVGERGPELIQFSGGEVVYSNADSMRIAAGLGPLRGFAKGSTAATRKARQLAATRKRARGEIPGDLTAFTRSLAGTTDDLSKALAALVKDVRAAGLSGRALASVTGKTAAKMLGLAKAQDAMASRVAAAKSAAADQKKTAADFLGVGNLAEADSVNALIVGMRDRQKTVKLFESQIKSLSKKGLSQDLISQLVAMGPDSQLAGVVAGASKGQIKTLNGLAKSGNSLSTSYGRTMADAMFDAGKDAGRGFLAGLIGQEKAIQAQMNKLGAGAVKAIRKALDSRSPSRKTRAVGEDTGAGLLIGILRSVPAVKAGAARLGRAAIPSAAAMAAQRAAATAAAAASPLTAGPAPQSAGAGLDGLQVRVFVGSEELSSLARTEVYKATGELVAIIDAGGGGN
ncbi:phage tail tape measure protein [Streptomyces californicus]|uniref:phage tail tape measure protein n=1 Tax=Streptomyces californicus TaxID=67351 RepID=UPI00296E55BC|nr:phage tail tape measure protein [Streptomyces californicus]MDW4900671.1 phage tail tape measure protein [Streptomyces californicus]